MKDREGQASGNVSSIGQCLTCVHARSIANPHGGDAYWRCGLSDADKRFPKYPRLPVHDCAGYAPRERV